MKTYKVIKGIFEGTVFKGIKYVTSDSQLRIWNRDSEGQSFLFTDCERVKKYSDFAKPEIDSRLMAKHVPMDFVSNYCLGYPDSGGNFQYYVLITSSGGTEKAFKELPKEVQEWVKDYDPNWIIKAHETIKEMNKSNPEKP